MQIDDLYAYVDVVEKAHPELSGLPFFLGGGSLGGLIAAHAALRSQAKWAGLVLQSPALDVEWTLVLKCAAATPRGGGLGQGWSCVAVAATSNSPAPLLLPACPTRGRHHSGRDAQASC